MKKLIQFENLLIRLNDRILYDQLNLTIYEGDRYVFIGPNGAGKSLLLNLITTGYSKAMVREYDGLIVKGSIVDSNGNDLLDPAIKRTIAYAPQNEDSYNNASILSEAESACHGVDIELDEKKLDYLLERFNILHLKKTRIKNRVSGGEGKLINLITRILMLPATNLLLLDEPLNHLSFENSKIFNDIIHDEIVSKPNLSIIMISHCKAMDFTKKALSYNSNTHNLEVTTYSAYDCFSN